MCSLRGLKVKTTAHARVRVRPYQPYPLHPNHGHSRRKWCYGGGNGASFPQPGRRIDGLHPYDHVDISFAGSDAVWGTLGLIYITDDDASIVVVVSKIAMTMAGDLSINAFCIR